MTDTNTTAPTLSVMPQYEPFLKLVNPRTGKPDDELAIAFVVEPQGCTAGTVVKTARGQLLIVDDSGWMEGAKAMAAQAGAEAWLDALPLGDFFAIIKFGNFPMYAYPSSGRKVDERN